ncbi:MAG: hypothetical protein J5928_05035 [Firmicutes bacterium]|nr:hypothetical protein [Bacillota bacterium]
MKKYIILLTLILIMTVLVLAACGGRSETAKGPLAEFEKADMSGYAGLEGYDGPLPFVDVTVQDVHKLIEAKETFVLFVSFEKCPWCNAVIKYFSEVAAEYSGEEGNANATNASSTANATGTGACIAYINTRKDPSWGSNLDIDDYDLFVEDFGEFLDYDSDNIKHLYVPHVFFIKDGAVAYEYQGALPAMGSDPNTVLTDEQIEELKDIYRAGFENLK